MFKKTFLNLRKIFTYPPFENVLLFLLQGSDYRGASTKFIPPPNLYSEGSISEVERDGIRYSLDKSCLMQWYVFWGLRDVTRPKLYRLINKGDVVLDVGTNVGETLLNFAGIVGEAGLVYGFEPDERNFNNVQKNIALNAQANVHVFKLGVSDQRETVRLFRVDPHNLGMNRILGNEESVQFDDYTTIETDTLDNIVTENKIDRLDVVKIDIEGYEMHALRGAAEILGRFKPRLFIEVGYMRLLKNGTSPTEMIRFLNGYGYRVFHADTDEPIDESYDFSPLGDGGIDVYAIDREAVEQWQ